MFCPFGCCCACLPVIQVFSDLQLTLWNGPLDDGEVGREALLSDGAVSVDCQRQDARVGDDPARCVLSTVPPNIRADWKEDKKKNRQ